jgi:hypothetical protein
MNLKKYIVLCFSALIALASLFSFGLGSEVNATGTPQSCHSKTGTSACRRQTHP